MDAASTWPTVPVTPDANRAGRYPTLEARLSKDGRTLVDRVRRNLPPETVDPWRVAMAFSLSRPGDFLGLAADDPRLLFDPPRKNESQATNSARFRPGYARRHVHSVWVEYCQTAPELLMAPLAAGLLETDTPLWSTPDNAPQFGREAWVTPIEALCSFGVGADYLGAICADRGIVLPRVFHQLMRHFLGIAKGKHDQQVAEALFKDRCAGINPHLHRDLPGAPNLIALLVNRLFLRPSVEPFTAVRILDCLIEAGADLTEEIFVQQVGRVPPLHALLERAGNNTAAMLAVHLIKTRPGLAATVPEFDKVARQSIAGWHGRIRGVGGAGPNAEWHKRALRSVAALEEIVKEHTGARCSATAGCAPPPGTSRPIRAPVDPATATAILRAAMTNGPTDLEVAAHEGSTEALRALCVQQGIPVPRTYRALIEFDALSLGELRQDAAKVIAALSQDRRAGVDLALEKRIPGAPSLLALEINRLLGSGRHGLPDAIEHLWKRRLDRLIDAGADPSERIWVQSLGRVTPLEALLTHPKCSAAPTVALHLIERHPGLMDGVPNFADVAKRAARAWRTWPEGESEDAVVVARLAPSVATAADDLDAVRVIYEQRSAIRASAHVRNEKPSSGARARVF